MNWRKKLFALILCLSLLANIGMAIGYTIDTNTKERINDNGVKATPPGWSEDVRLTYIQEISGFADIASESDNIFVVWKDARSGVYEIYFKKSENGGLNWTPDAKISAFTPSPFCYPQIAINGSQIHVVWEGLDITREVHYRKSIDSGETWNPEVRLSEDDGFHSFDPRICVVGSNVHVGWSDKKDYPPTPGVEPEIYYRNSTDNGATWNPSQRLTFYTDADGIGGIQANGSKIHITWARWLIKNEVFYMNSNDGGITWDPEQQLTPDNGIDTGPYSIAVWQDNVHLVFGEQSEVYYINSTDGGNSWNPSIRISNLGNSSISPDIATDEEDVYIVWQDNRDNYGYDGAYEIYYAYSNDSGTTWSDDIRFTYALNGSGAPTICANNSMVHVIWQDNRTGGIQDIELYYKHSPDFPDPTYNITLNEGWNLISTPLIQRDESIDNVLENITGKWDYIQAYDSINGTWLSNATFKPDQLNDLKSLNHKMAFWINITEPGGTVLTVSGPIPDSTTISLYAGWNLVGYPSLTTETVANALWGTGADKVEKFDSLAPYRISEVGPTYVMKPGEGYWIHVPADTVWIINW